jgi:hypothetical protein
LTKINSRSQGRAVTTSTVKEHRMNRLAWIGLIVWGLVITALGLVSAGPVPAEASVAVQPHDVILLVASGLITCLIGVPGLTGLMGWVPGLRKEQKNIAECTPANGRDPSSRRYSIHG